MKTIAVVFGTRPEALKCAPLINALRKEKEFRTLVCVFRQHGIMLDQVLSLFHIKPDYDFPISLNDKNLFHHKAAFLKKGISGIRTLLALFRFVQMLRKEHPDFLIVQGDTSTALLSALIAFHFKITIVHVEAGLRTGDIYSPFPEEMNRKLIGSLARFHFASTRVARDNLLREGVPPERIWVTGNTIIDTLFYLRDQQKDEHERRVLETGFLNDFNIRFMPDVKYILVTAHRRESFGEGLAHICTALRKIVEQRQGVVIIYPVHLNPHVMIPVREVLQGIAHIMLIDPLPYDKLVYVLEKCFLVLTDSGGIQEEAAALGKPTLVMRNTTERGEGVSAGVARCVGSDTDQIVKETLRLLDDKKAYETMAHSTDVYGDGTASEKIAGIIKTL